MRFKNISILLYSLTLVCACAIKNVPVKTDAVKAPAPSNTPAPASLPNSIAKVFSPKQERISELLLFIENYSNLAPDAQKKIFASTNQSLAENKNNLLSRSKLAIMLALPTSRLRDPIKAQNLLQDLLREDGLDAQENALLGLLYEYAIDDTKQWQKSREDAKKLEASQQKYEVLQQKHETLEQKLNELKNIEKTMGERNIKTDSKP